MPSEIHRDLRPAVFAGRSALTSAIGILAPAYTNTYPYPALATCFYLERHQSENIGRNYRENNEVN